MGLIDALPLSNAPLSKREVRLIKEDEKNKVLTEVGLMNSGQVFVFRCPICNKTETNDQRMELACTGPGWTDDHPLEPMDFVGVKPKESTILIPGGVKI